jgi:TatD DNase family protein
MTLIDTHCHLDFDVFNCDRTDVLFRAQQAGLIRIVNPGVDLDNSLAILHLCDSHTEVFAAVGIHPTSALTWTQETRSTLRELAQHPKVVAIGEIGLDFYHQHAPKDVQKRIFREQLDLAGELALPVIMHSRQAEIETFEICALWATKRSPNSSPPGVFHSYAGDEITAQKAITSGFYIGITGPITYKNAAWLQRLVTLLPTSSLVIETDSPFLTPHPHRGDRNEPAFVRLVAEKIASLKNQTLEHISEITTANAKQLFQWR